MCYKRIQIDSKWNKENKNWIKSETEPIKNSGAEEYNNYNQAEKFTGRIQKQTWSSRINNLWTKRSFQIIKSEEQKENRMEKSKKAYDYYRIP